MDTLGTALCDDCSGRWDCMDFWYSCLTDAELSQVVWGPVHCRIFGDIEETKQCTFCQLIIEGLTHGGKHRIDRDCNIDFSKYLFGDSESRSSQAGLNGSHSVELEQPGGRRHFVNHIRISTIPVSSNARRE